MDREPISLVNPRISVITPCLNGRKFIESYFDAFVQQQAPVSIFEVIVIDNGSSDRSVETLLSLSESVEWLTVRQFDEKMSSYAARNFGVSVARGEILAFTDIDCVPQPDWISSIDSVRGRLLSGVIVSGRVDLVSKNRHPTAFEAYDMIAHMRQDYYAESNKGATANLSVSASTFSEHGGFVELTSGGDVEFCQRARRQGVGFWFNKEIAVKHPARNTYVDLAKKEDRKAIGGVEKLFVAKPSRVEIFAFLVRNFLGIVLPINQFRLSILAFRNGVLTPALCGLIFWFGWLQRWRLITNCVVRSLSFETPDEVESTR